MPDENTAPVVEETQIELMDALDSVGEEPLAPAEEPSQPPAAEEPEAAAPKAAGQDTAPDPVASEGDPAAGQVQEQGDQPQADQDPRDARIAALEAMVNKLAGGPPPPQASPSQDQPPRVQPADKEQGVATPAPAQPADPQPAAYQPQEFMTAAEAEAEGLDAGVFNAALNRLGEHLWRNVAQAVQGAKAAAEQVQQQAQYDSFMADFFVQHKDLIDMRPMVGRTLEIMSAEAQAKGEGYKDKLTLMTALAAQVRQSLGRPAPATVQEIKTVDKDGKVITTQPPSLTGLGAGRRGGPPAPVTEEGKTQLQLMAELDSVDA